MKTTLVISVYKNTNDLHVVLQSLKFQTHTDFDIIISEDGSSTEMREFVNRYKATALFPVTHLTQPDEGWRKNKALNNAVRHGGDYLIFIDGDCVVHHKFIENHIRLSDPKKIVAGKRVKLGAVYSDLFRNNIDSLLELEQRVEKEGSKVRQDGGKFFEEAFYINPDGPLWFVTRLRRMNQLKGCNMSFYREAIEAINGFDEDYQLPAIGEDIDLTWRFKGMGYTLTSARNLCVQYHLHHKENWTDQAVNQALMELKMVNREFVCKNGLTKLYEASALMAE